MAFKRSSVRSRSAPPPFALESLQSFGWQATFSPSRYVKDGPFGSEGCPPKPWRRGTIMKYVYLLQSLSFPTQRYVGVTTNLKERLQAHNAGASLHTSKYRPWKVVMYLCFQDDRRAAEFERYLKTGSGQAFANKHLW
jgi:putative endonuclease